MNILTFDIEDWFHILDNPETQSVKEWSKFESRLDLSLDLILEMLNENDQRATFFIVGWVAKKHPNSIKKIVDAGYEIGTHTDMHQLVYSQNKSEFEEDLHRSINTLQDISGDKIRCFRAPGFSITPETPWAFEALIKEGIEIDCSIFPANRAHGGFNSFGTAEPVMLDVNGMKLKEFPINVHQKVGRKLIFSGGGYFRLFPYQMIKSLTKKSPYVMSYFHPRDFDPGQPMVPGLSMTRKFKSYYGLKSTKPKLKKWIRDFEFIDIQKADSNIDWSVQRVLKL